MNVIRLRRHNGGLGANAQIFAKLVQVPAYGLAELSQMRGLAPVSLRRDGWMLLV